MTVPPRVINFGAGPCALPESVLEKVQSNLLNLPSPIDSMQFCGMSILELGHRTPEFETILNNAEVDLRQILTIPDNYRVLFLAAGATGQFAAIPLNLLGNKDNADYIVTGVWSKKAAEEASKYCKVNVIASTEESNFTQLPNLASVKFSQDPAYVYYCANETVNGVEFQDVPAVPDHVPLVGDFSSSFLSHEINVEKFGLIYAGAQKNIGPAGVVVVIIRTDLLDRALKICPSVWHYKTEVANKSMLNTPPCFNIYVVGLVFDHIKKLGLKNIRKLAEQKALLLYNTIDESNGFYTCQVAHNARSKMNVVFFIEGGKETENAFLKAAKERNMVQLSGHRSVGGMRASLYNAMSLEGVHQLVEFMKLFQLTHQYAS